MTDEIEVWAQGCAALLALFDALVVEANGAELLFLELLGMELMRQLEKRLPPC